MKKKVSIFPFVYVFYIILLIFLYLLIIDRNPSDLPSALLNKKIPKFETKFLNNNNFISSEQFTNEIILVNFFATWCKPCRDEHIYIKRFANERGIKVIGINYKDSQKNAIKWLNELENPI